MNQKPSSMDITGVEPHHAASSPSQTIWRSSAALIHPSPCLLSELFGMHGYSHHRLPNFLKYCDITIN
jgi:hypothetical protein